MSPKLSELLSRLSLDSNLLNSELAEINSKLQDPETLSDQSKYVTLLKRNSKLNEFLAIINSLDKAFIENDEAYLLLDDPDMSQLASEELAKTQSQIDELSLKLEQLAIKPLDNDDKKALFEIRPGVGGVEASLFAEELYRMYIKYFSNKGLKIEQYSMTYNQEGGINEATFLVDEPDSFGELRFEGGVHRVQRVPSTESSGRIHTSSASVAILPQFDKSDLNIKPEELRIDVYRSSGPGGQSVNTTDSAVRITHLPTRIVVTCQAGKSQHKNKDMAMSILMTKLQELEDEKKNSTEKSIKSDLIRGGDRSAKIRTYNFPQGRITDHRIKQSWFNVDEVMNGNLEEIITSVNTQLRAMIRQSEE